MKLTCIGSGEAFATGLGNHAYLLTPEGPVERSSVPTLLFDCGYQIPERLWQRDETDHLQGIVISHFHADHIFGLAPLIARFHEEKRADPLRIVGPRGIEKAVRGILELGYPGVFRKLGFALDFVEASPRQEIEWGDCVLSFAASKHSILNLAVRCDFSGKTPYRSFAYSGDGRITLETIALYYGVDLLLHEVYSLKKSSPVHTSLAELVQVMGHFAEEKTGRIQTVGVAHFSRIEQALIEKAVVKLKKKSKMWRLAKPGATFHLERKT